MGTYRARDLLRVPGLLSLARIPLALLFPFVVDNAWLSLALLLIAGSTDLLDGWYARRFDQVSAAGALVDPITDKLFVLTVAVTLMVRGDLPWLAAPALAAREVLELPLVLWMILDRKARAAREDTAPNLPGKIVTLLQFASVAAALFHSRLLIALLAATALLGTVAALAYWRTELLRRSQTRSQSQ